MLKERIYLRGLEPRPDGAVWESGKRLRIGRVEKYELVLDDPSVSRQHAEVILTSQGWVIRDLGSTNGTFLNGTRVCRAEAKLQEGDIIQVGDVGLVVEAIKDSMQTNYQNPDLGIEVLYGLDMSWDEILALDEAQGFHKNEFDQSLKKLVGIGRNCYALESTDAYLDRVLWEVAELFDIQYGAFILRDDKAKKLAVRATFTMGNLTKPEAHSCLKLAEWALSQGKTLLCRPIEPLVAERGVAGAESSKGGVAGAESSKPRPNVGNAVGNAQSGVPTMILVVLRLHNKQLGVLYLCRGGNQKPFALTDLYLAEAFNHWLAISIQGFDDLLAKKRDLVLQILTTLSHLVHLRDNCLGSHSDKATDYALLIAEELQVPEPERHHLQITAPLRDLGRIGIPDSLHGKPDKLSPQETVQVKSHVLKGVALLETIPFLVPLIPIVRSHHEHWDGSGYPDGIAGNNIPLLARIVAVADALDAMTSPRPYRQLLSLDEAFAEIQCKAGTQFDPDCVAALVKVRARIEEIVQERELLQETYSWEQIKRIVNAPGNQSTRESIFGRKGK